MLKKILHSCAFFTRNYWRMSNAAFIRPYKTGAMTYRGYKKEDAEAISIIYAQLNKGATFSGLRRLLYSCIGNRCLWVATHTDDAGNEVAVGMNIYYLNTRDAREHTIHEGFIGVIPSMEGRGIASTMRKLAKEHFTAAGFKGISTRVSLSNTASLHSAKKIGFKPTEEYIETSTGEHRYYMISRLADPHAEQ